MTTEQTTAPDISTNAGNTELWVERTGTRLYTGRNSRGAEVSIGGVEVEGAFSPGELLKIALAGCSGLSADSKPAHRLPVTTSTWSSRSRGWRPRSTTGTPRSPRSSWWT